jgi:hypothetical protein
LLITVKDRSESPIDLKIPEMQVSDYAMALDLLSKITQSGAENEAIENILEIVTILFSPQKRSFISLRGNASEPGYVSSLSVEHSEAIRSLAADITRKYAWTASERGFLVKINYKENLLGILEVDEISFPEYKAHYLNLCLSIADVCGLALENASRYQQIKDSECRLEKEKEKLEDALAQVKQLSGLLPICMHCKKIRDDKGYWNQIESFIQAHSEAKFSHGICQVCAKKHYPELNIYND